MNDAKRRAKHKYKDKIEELRVELYPTDNDIKAHLAAQSEPKATFIKRLIRKDIETQKARYGANEGARAQGEKKDD